MAYGTRAGMESIFGTSRIAHLADWDATGVSATITANITTSLSFADDYINARMRLSHYRIPLATAAGATPGMIGSIANRIAGGYLTRQWRLENVPPEDSGERVLQYEREAKEELEQVVSGRLKIDAV